MKLTPWWLNPYLLGLIALLAGAGWVYWKGGKESRQEVKALTQAAKDTAKSNEISRSTQERIGTEGYETRKRAQQDDRALRQGADPGAAAADDGGMRVVQDAYERALCAASRVRREKSCNGAAGSREHN